MHWPERDTMLMTHLAILDAGEPEPGHAQRLRDRILRFFGLDVDVNDSTAIQDQAPASRQADLAITEPILRLVSMEPEIAERSAGFRWRRHPQLLKPHTPDISTDQRGARHDAVRGLYAARAGAFDVAREQFARAATCTDIDLSAIPGFWQLSRSAMMTAVEAYEQVDRIRDAAALNAQIRTMYRPRALTSVPENVTHLHDPVPKISSNS